MKPENISINKLTFMPMDVLPVCILVDHMHASCPQRTEEGMRFPGTEIINSHEFCEYWETNIVPLEG